MIDIKTLRIGAHISIGGKRVRVCGITKRKIGYHHPDDRPNAHLRYARIHDVEPISLTPELLTELGFECRDLGFAELWKRGDFDLEHKHHSVYWECKGGANIEFLHELENLYYLIYERELIPD